MTPKSRGTSFPNLSPRPQKLQPKYWGKIDLVNPPRSLDNYIHEKTKAEETKLQRELKNAQSLNCLGGVKNQESTPTRNGTSSKKVRFKPLTSTTVPSKKNKWKKKRGKKAVLTN